jgi:hypothetical protein
MHRLITLTSLAMLASVAGAQPMVPADSPSAAALPSTTPTVVDNTLPPPPAAAMEKDYPVCSRTVQDSCRNPGEGGAKAGSHRHHRR